MQVDVVVIGAGIHGVGVAQAAAAAGYSVAILEKNSPASGTSCKSSKLIHGGLRYLESGQFKLVKECLYERHLLLQNAPDLVQLKPFYIPVYHETSRSRWKIRAGLALYYMLSGFRQAGNFNELAKSQWSSLDGLKAEGLQSVMQYWDAQTDDELLTKAVLRSALALGAELICPANVVAAEKRNGQWQVFYENNVADKNATDNNEIPNNSIRRSLSASVVVNAAGPWVNDVLFALNAKSATLGVDLVQGTHIILPEKTHQGIYYIEAPSDRRAIFVMPWGEETLIGTTEKNFLGAPDDVRPCEEEIDYLLTSSSAYFPRFARYNSATISRAFAGLRVLPSGEGGAFHKARETIIYENKKDNPAVFSIYGGKLTAYRATAEQVLQNIRPYLPPRTAQADTKKLKLTLD